LENDDTPDPTSPTWDAAALAASVEKVRLLRALFANQIFVQPDGLHLRMSFGERVNGEALYHSSIVVPNSDALEFGQLIVRLAQEATDRQFEMMKQTFAAKAQGENNAG
jgi:hypothetical protein